MENKKNRRNVLIFLILLVIVIAVIAIVMLNKNDNEVQEETMDISVIVGDKTDSNNIMIENKTAIKKNGKYAIKLNNTVNDYVFKSIFREDGKGIKVSDKEKEIQLTDEEVENKSIRLTGEFDKKDARNGNEIVTLYKRKIKEDSGEITIEGYVPERAMINLIQIDSLNNDNLDQNYEVDKAYMFSIEYDRDYKKYNPVDFNEEITITANEENKCIIYKENDEITYNSIAKKTNYINTKSIENATIIVLKKK